MQIQLLDNKWFENPVLINAFINFCATYGFAATVDEEGDGFHIRSLRGAVDEEVFPRLPMLFELSILTDIVFSDTIKIQQ